MRTKFTTRIPDAVVTPQNNVIAMQKVRIAGTMTPVFVIPSSLNSVVFDLKR